MHKRRERIILTKPLIVTQALHGSVLVLASFAAAFPAPAAFASAAFPAAAATPAVVAAEFARWFVPYHVVAAEFTGWFVPDHVVAAEFAGWFVPDQLQASSETSQSQPPRCECFAPAHRSLVAPFFIREMFENTDNTRWNRTVGINKYQYKQSP